MDLRASDAERERVAAFLRDRCLEGRLDPDELDERIATALRARTHGELAELVADLPGGVAALPTETALATAPPPAPPAKRLALPVIAVLAVLALAVPFLLAKELLVLAGITALAFTVLGMILLVTLGPWLAAGAGAVWAARRFQERRRPPAA